MPLTDHFFMDAPNRISQIECFGSTNTGEALEMLNSSSAPRRSRSAQCRDPDHERAAASHDGRVADSGSASRQCSNPTDRCTAPPVVCTEVRTAYCRLSCYRSTVGRVHTAWLLFPQDRPKQKNGTSAHLTPKGIPASGWQLSRAMRTCRSMTSTAFRSRERSHWSVILADRMLARYRLMSCRTS